MTLDPRNAALSDNDLLALGKHYFDSADRDGARMADFTALRDFVPALLHRLREKVEITRDLVCIPEYDLNQLALFEHLQSDAVSTSGSR